MTLGLSGAATRRDFRDELPPLIRRYARTSERALFRGYSPSVVPVAPRPCVCGGLIEPGTADRIPETVADHNHGREHQAWRDRGESP